MSNKSCWTNTDNNRRMIEMSKSCSVIGRKFIDGGSFHFNDDVTSTNATMDYTILYNVFHWFWHTNLLECDVINHRILEPSILLTSFQRSQSTEINGIAKEFAIVLSAFARFGHFQVVLKFKCFRYQWLCFTTDIIINFKLQSLFLRGSGACWVAIQEAIKRNIETSTFSPAFDFFLKHPDSN